MNGVIVAKVDQNDNGECEVHVFTDLKDEEQAAVFESKVD